MDTFQMAVVAAVVTFVTLIVGAAFVFMMTSLVFKYLKEKKELELVQEIHETHMELSELKLEVAGQENLVLTYMNEIRNANKGTRRLRARADNYAEKYEVLMTDVDEMDARELTPKELYAGRALLSGKVSAEEHPELDTSPVEAISLSA
jgi:hypothetical protein